MTTEFEKMERDGWADPSIAKGYADTFDRATKRAATALADYVGAARGQHILDLCTGHGVVAAELVARGADVTGLDFSPSMISLAEVAVPDAMFIQGDAMSMPFAVASYDAVTAGFGVPHLPDVGEGFAEIARILKPGGRLAFSIWRGAGSDGSMGWLFDALARLGDASVTLPAGPDAYALCDPDLARAAVEPAGFCDVQVHDIPSELHVCAPEELFDTFYRGSVRAASLLTGQPADCRAAIRDDLAEHVVKLGTAVEDGYHVPIPSVAVVAIRKA